MSDDHPRPMSRITDALLAPAPGTPAPAHPAAPPTGPADPRSTGAPLPAEVPAAPAVPAGSWAARAPYPHGGDVPAVETTTRLRPVRDAHRPVPPSAAAPAHAPAHAETPFETTTRLRPVRERRSAGRNAAVAACLVLGLGLIGVALAGVWLAASEPRGPVEPAGYAEAKELWHNAPVDTLFPRTVSGPTAGPGGAARTWTRIVVAPDAPCTPAVLARNLLATLRPLGCERVLRATYTDATASSVITVGLAFTRADATAQRALGDRTFAIRLGDDVPPALAGPGTVASDFGARQRAGWWLTAPVDLPVVITAVSGFADGRTVDRAQRADRATARGRTDAVAQSGLGHEARGIAERFESQLRTTVAAATRQEEDAR
ncbi:hypothetical protein [Streptomyces sp. NPDC003327]